MSHYSRLTEEKIAALRKASEPLFDLGDIAATPAVQRHLERHGLPAIGLLTMHQLGEFGALDAEDVATNNQALVDGSRIVSAYRVGDQMVYVITEAADACGVRPCTCVLLASEY